MILALDNPSPYPFWADVFENKGHANRQALYLFDSKGVVFSSFGIN
jgi:hypothetical protein